MPTIHPELPVLIPSNRKSLTDTVMTIVPFHPIPGTLLSDGDHLSKINLPLRHHLWQSSAAVVVVEVGVVVVVVEVVVVVVAVVVVVVVVVLEVVTVVVVVVVVV